MASSDIVQKFFSEKEKKAKNRKAFLKWLEKNVPDKIDDIIHDLHRQVFEEVDCLECANCCKTVGPAIKNMDIERLSKQLKIKPSKLVEQYMQLDDENDYIFRSHPCPFLLSDNYCTVYEARPKACREYPHTDRRRVMQLLQLHTLNTEHCPAVFEIFERLEKQLNPKK